MSVLIESDRRVIFGGHASLVEENRELAWAETHVVRNPALKWVLGKYVEADNANSNGHIFDLDELRTAKASIANSPLNMLHRPHYIVGNYVAAELMFPTGAPSTDALGADAGPRPYVEALAAFYRYYFPDEYEMVEKAHSEGSLFYSMEAVPHTITCKADDGCGQEFAYDGRTSPTYCAHLNEPGAKKRLNKPHFTGGALIIPPARPGWKRADVTELSSLLTERAEECEMAYEQVAQEFPHLDAKIWERQMAMLVQHAYREIEGPEFAASVSISKEQREQWAKQGIALPDGSYPIPNPDYLRRAILSYGHKPTPEVKAHIVKRAKALGKTSMLPEGWA